MSNTYEIYLVSDSTGETLDRIFLRGDYEFLKSILGTNFTLQNIQNIFIGNPIDNLNKSKINRSSD